METPDGQDHDETEGRTLSELTARHKTAALLVSLAVCFAAAAAASPVTRSATASWYHEIRRPSWTPPDRVFAPVWTALYAMMAVAAWTVYCRGGFRTQRLGLTLFITQLVLNAAWSFIFFGLRLFGVALVELVLLWCAILATMLVFWRRSTLAGWLMLPYLVWVTYASTLNFAIWWLNR